MSKKNPVSRESYSVSDALYDAKRSEVRQETIAGLVFLAIGLIIIIVSFLQYSNISESAQEPSDDANAIAWLIIAGVGAVIGVIGLIRTIKSATSFSGIATSIKGMMSKASPFQSQPVNRGVAAVTQTQAMSEAPTKGMSERSRSVGYKGTQKKSKKTAQSSGSSAKLYDKYHPSQPNQSPRMNPAPQSQPPSKVQKFDYGIEEANKKTFADKFLEKNKKDPFEEYRKELGIKEEPKKAPETKPQFIISNRAPSENLTYGMPQEQVAEPVRQTLPVHQAQHIKQAQSTSSSAQSYEKNSSSAAFIAQNEATQNQRRSSAVNSASPQYTIPTVRHEDDDFFLSFNASEHAPVTQKQAVEAAELNTSKSKTANIRSEEEEFFLNYQPSDGSTEYSLDSFDDNTTGKVPFEKSNKPKISATAQKSVGGKNINLSYGLEETVESKSTEDSEEPALSYNMGKPIKNLDEVMETAELNLKPLQRVKNAKPQQTIPTAGSTPKSASQAEKYNFEAFADNKQDSSSYKSKDRPEQSVKQTKKIDSKKDKSGVSPSLSNIGIFKKKDKRKKEEAPAPLQQDNSKSSGNREICTNGTRSQRKFVDASEYDEWSCPSCGKVNQEYVGVCCCGTRKPRAK